MIVSAVIPTKNRPQDLIKAVRSLLKQKRIPDQLIIVDQSDSDESYNLVNDAVTKASFSKLIYVHDKSISGLVEAKFIAQQNSIGDIICFLEDDVVLDAMYIYEVERGFHENYLMMGCSGIITNPPIQSSIRKFLYRVFHLGIFTDPRPYIFGCYSGYENPLILCNVLSGGLSCWKKDVFDKVPFDLKNGFFMMEDIDFSTRVVDEFGKRLYVNPNAQLSHFYSPINREVAFTREVRKITEYIVFFKKRKSVFNFFCLIWLNIGLFLDALSSSFKFNNMNIIFGYFIGLKQGFLKKVR